MAGEAALPFAVRFEGSFLKRRLVLARRCAFALQWLIAIGLGWALFAPVAYADPMVTATASLTSPGNAYGRLVLQFSEDTPTDVMMAGSILVVHFAKPVNISADDLGDVLPAYVGSVRSDPDGTAIRLALMQTVKVNTMTAGERVFIDLLPEKWTGPPPSLPPEVIKELSDRAMAAERALRAQKQAEETKKRPPVRVRTSVQPTFVRFTFELPEGISVSSSLNADKYTLSFSAPLTFDLADAKVIAPSNIKSIGQSATSDASAVEMALVGEVDVHSFREDRNYVVDVGFDAKKQPVALPVQAMPAQQSALPPKNEVSASATAGAAKTSESAPPKSNEITSQKETPQKETPQKEAAQQPKPVETDKSASTAPAPAVQQAQPKPSIPAEEAPAPAVNPPVEKAEIAPSAAAVAAAEPAAMPSPPAVSAPAPAPDTQPKAEGLPVIAKRTSDDFRMIFPFGSSTPVAVFKRSDAVWMVIADSRPLNLHAITTEGGSLVSGISVLPVAGGQAIRLSISRPMLPSLTGDDQNLILTLSERDQAPSQALVATRNVADPAIANVSIAFVHPGPILKIAEPDIGDTLSVVTGQIPARGFTRKQTFVEFSLLESTQGIVFLANSDDVSLQSTADKIIISRPRGLTLSAANAQPDRATAPVSAVFDVPEWKDNLSAPFLQRLDELTTAAAESSGDARVTAHIALANFYMSRGFYQEAKGVMDVALAKPSQSTSLPKAIMVRAVAEVLGGRFDQALKDINDPAVGSNFDSQLWTALAYARLGRWTEAREKFKNSEFSVIALPLELQRIVLLGAMRAALEVKDYASASARNNDLQTLGVAPDQTATLALLRGRLSEALGRDKDAVAGYHAAASSDDRPIAAEAELSEIALRRKRHEISDDDALHQLEILSVLWRGDATEAKNLQMMSRLYIDKQQYPEALAAAMQATKLDPNSVAARALQDDAAELFTQIFLTDKGDNLPPIKALGLFYQYRDLTPIGRRGDEIIRRLADRLVAVDLLDQASDLLQYQVDKRLEGAARAQVASRLATIYLMNRKPDRAIAALNSTRIGDLAGELRQQRLLLEARAQSDIGRYDLALDIISNISGPEAIRLRSDIYWATRKWRESAEQIEVLYGDRWRDFQPLTDIEKSDIIRAAIGYALANDSIGIARFREKYGPKMESEADKSAFAIASQPASGAGADLERIAKMAASVDTLEGFLREMRKRFPETMARAKLPPALGADVDATGALPKIEGNPKVSAAQ